MADTRYRVDGLLVDSCPAAPVHHGPHTHTQDGAALHCPGHPAPPPQQLAGGRPTASTITDDQLDALHQQLADQAADLERARRWAVRLENENARLKDYAAIDKQVMEKADRECDEHIAAAREFRKWGEECQRVGTRYWLAWTSARQRAAAHGESILRLCERLCEDRDSWKGWMWEQAARAERAEQQTANVRALHRKASHGLVCVYCAPLQRIGYDATWPCDTIRALEGDVTGLRAAYCGSRAPHGIHDWQDYAQPCHCPGYPAIPTTDTGTSQGVTR